LAHELQAFPDEGTDAVAAGEFCDGSVLVGNVAGTGFFFWTAFPSFDDDKFDACY
jgi:hypothetical protein